MIPTWRLLQTTETLVYQGLKATKEKYRIVYFIIILLIFFRNQKNSRLNEQQENKHKATAMSIE